MEAKVSFKKSQSSFKAPVKAGTSVGTLTYTDPEPIGKGYIEGKSPSMEMVSGENISKSFFLKVWWNQFVRYVNEKL